MACCIRDAARRSKISQWASPGLKQILLKLYRAEKPMEMDHHLYEYGCVEYHIKSSSLDPHNIYVSISTPILAQGTNHVSPGTLEVVEGICSGVIKTVEPPKQGYELTLLLKFANITRPKDSTRMITDIAAVQSVLVISQLKQIFQNLSSRNTQEKMFKPIKLVYHPREPFFITKQAEKIIALLPMRFKEDADVVIATSFFQELTEVGSLEGLAKAPRFMWSPIPPPELRGESMEDLSTNGGFITIDVLPRHVEEKRLDKTVWNILNFYTYVKSYVKCTKGFILRKLRKRLSEMAKALDQTASLDDAPDDKPPTGCGYRIKAKGSSKLKKMKRKCGDLSNKMKRIRYKIKIRGFGYLRGRWFLMSRSSKNKYMKLE